METLDPKLIEQLLAMSRQARVEYLNSLPPEQRELVNQALSKASRQKLKQDLLNNLNRNSRES